MMIRTLGKIGAALMLATAMAGCSSWDNMSHRQKSAVTGAGLGGVAGGRHHRRGHPGHGGRRGHWRRHR